MAVVASACVFQTEVLPVVDAGLPPPGGGAGGGVGDGGGGGGGGIGDGGGGIGGILDGGIGDAGLPPIPGTGKDGDRGTGVLVMLRIDQGTANIASPVQIVLKQIADALTGAGLQVTSVAVSEMYAQQPIWASRDIKNPVPGSLADLLREVSTTRTAAAPTTCSTDALLNEGASLWAWSVAGANNVWPFSPGPDALLVILIDSGARPQALASCKPDMFSASDPISWARLDHALSLAQTRFLMLATTENPDLTAMRQRCAAVPGFPLGALDVLAPSSIAFFDPWADQMNAKKSGLANRIDLCEALGAGAPEIWRDVAKSWFQVLEALR